jgi:hypothetical protein
MKHIRVSPSNQIPAGLKPYFQEYDPSQLDLRRDANLIIQRGLEFGTWDEIRWLFKTYGSRRIRLFLREHGQRWLKPVTFHYWRKLLGIRKWKSSPFPTTKGELWNR